MFKVGDKVIIDSKTEPMNQFNGKVGMITLITQKINVVKFLLPIVISDFPISLLPFDDDQLTLWVYDSH